MTACPIRYQRQVPDRKGKIFYTSITSLSHISKVPGDETVDGGRWRRSDWYGSCSFACESVFLIIGERPGRRRELPVTYRLSTAMLERN